MPVKQKTTHNLEEKNRAKPEDLDLKEIYGLAPMFCHETVLLLLVSQLRA